MSLRTYTWIERKPLYPTTVRFDPGRGKSDWRGGNSLANTPILRLGVLDYRCDIRRDAGFFLRREAALCGHDVTVASSEERVRTKGLRANRTLSPAIAKPALAGPATIDADPRSRVRVPEARRWVRARVPRHRGTVALIGSMLKVSLAAKPIHPLDNLVPPVHEGEFEYVHVKIGWVGVVDRLDVSESQL